MSGTKNKTALVKVMHLVGAVAKNIYNRLFLWIVTRCNQSLKIKKAHRDDNNHRMRYIGVLDIAGFEILSVNALRICIC